MQKPNAQKIAATKAPALSAARGTSAKIQSQQPERFDQLEAPVQTLTPNTSATLSIDALLASARRIAREETLKHPRPIGDKTNAVERPILPQLAKALRRDAPGETRLANGMIKVVTTTGAVYCLKPLPKFALGGPVEPMIIPTNCPS